jgi:hypothetical protein
MRICLQVVAIICICAFLGACGQSKLSFETVVDNLDSGKNTELHAKEYWKSIEHQELASSGVVVDVKDGRRGAEVTVAKSSRPTSDGINMDLKVTDVARAAKLKVKESIKFKGALREYKNRRNGEVVIYLDEVVITN